MPTRSLLISIGGGHATGLYELSEQIKTRLEEAFHDIKVEIIDLDLQRLNLKGNTATRYYSYKDYNFDLLYDHLVGIKTNNGDNKDGRNVVTILCGSYSLYDKRINCLADLKVYLDSDADKRLINLIRQRDVDGLDGLSHLIAEYMDHLRVEMDRYIQPTRMFADLVIPTKSESLGCEIVCSGIFKLVDRTKSETLLKSSTGQPNIPVSQPLWDFQTEQLDVEKGRYYDLS